MSPIRGVGFPIFGFAEFIRMDTLQTVKTRLPLSNVFKVIYFMNYRSYKCSGIGDLTISCHLLAKHDKTLATIEDRHGSPLVAALLFILTTS